MIKAGPVVQVELGRHVKHDPALAGLGNVGATAEVGGFVDYWPVPWLRTRVESVLVAVAARAGAHRVVLVDRRQRTQREQLFDGGAREATEPYFDISASAASGCRSTRRCRVPLGRRWRRRATSGIIAGQPRVRVHAPKSAGSATRRW
jgi:hypothetical protein